MATRSRIRRLILITGALLSVLIAAAFVCSETVSAVGRVSAVRVVTD